MRRALPCLLVSAIGLLAACTPLPERLDGYMSGLEATGFSGTLVVFKDGSTVFERGYGLANRERGVGNTGATVFPFGSNVKDLTRAGIIELEVDGVLSRDQRLMDFFEDVPSDKAPITIDQLLTHTSGLHPYHGTRQAGVPADHVELSEDTARSLIFGQELLFAPGERFSYSNSGYTLLAMIAERVSGRTFPEFIRQRFVEPAGMTRSGFYRDPRWGRDDVAVGYGDVTFGEENSPVYWPTNAWPVAGNGGMAGPVADLLAAVRYIDRRRGESEVFDRAWRETTPPGPPDGVYGGAGGNDFGFVSVVFYWPARGVGLALAGNDDDDGTEDPAMVADLLRIAFDIDPAELGGDADGDEDGPPADLAGADALPSPEGDWGLPDRGTWRRVGLVFDALADDDPSALRRLVDDMLTPRFRSTAPTEEHLREWAEMRERLVPFTVTGAEVENKVRFKLKLRSENGRESTLTLALERRSPYRVDEIGLEP